MKSSICMDHQTARNILSRISDNLNSVIIGKKQNILQMITGLASGGSILLEDVPGIGKTTLARSLAKSIRADFGRIQFTPDLLPADIIGSSVYNPSNGSFSFRKGPVFCNILLADEINRASPRTQSALLEAMNEQQVTVEGITYPLSSPFSVIATQNPVEYQGTYPLPEAQLDRFLMRLDLGYPDADTEASILTGRTAEDPVHRLCPVCDCREINDIQSLVKEVSAEQGVVKYIVTVCTSTRNHQDIRLGVSPRGTLMLFRSVQARAFLSGRDYILPDDVQAMAVPVLAHRIILSEKARYSGKKSPDVISELVDSLNVPV